MPWYKSALVFQVVLASWMNGISTAYVDACARQLGSKRLRIQLPWEQAPLDDVFSSRPSQVIPKPEWVDFPLQLFDPAKAVTRPAKLDRFNARLHLSEVSWVAAESKQHNLALQCWKVIVLDSTNHTGLGQLLMSCIEQGKSDDYIWQVVSDSFSCKATSTLRSRAASLLAFGRWKKATFVRGTSGVFPISEEVACEYLCHLRALRLAPSKGKRFLEAVGFAKGLVGADVTSVLNSARVKGVAMGTTAAPPKKKFPFTVDQMVQLERFALHGHGQESVFAGYICFLVHARLRWTDGQHCIQEPTLDLNDGRGFLEAALYHHKTAKKRRTNVVRLLPVAGVIPGVSGLNWAEGWLANRRKLGLRASMTQPTMPAPTADGRWSLQPLSASEASTWLRELLQPWNPVSLENVATHSAKSTILSWMSKSSVSLSLRRLAGYHIKPGDKSALEYSRDAAAPILRQIEAIFIAIRAGFFKPDELRSKRWCGAQSLDQAVQLASACQSSSQHVGQDDMNDLFGLSTSQLLEKKPETKSFVREVERESSTGLKLRARQADWDDDVTLDRVKKFALAEKASSSFKGLDFEPSDMSDDVSSITSSEDSDSNSDDLERRAEIDGEKNASDLVAPSDLAGKNCFRHVKSGKLHFVDKSVDGQKFFKCGRKCNENYMQISIVPAFTAHGCMTCFGWSDTRRGDDSSE